MLPLFRRREVWVPTLWGWLALGGTVALLGWLYARHAYDFLAQNAPARGRDGQGARVLVIEGWIPREADDDALALLRRHDYRHVIVSGGQDPPSERGSAERHAQYLRWNAGRDVTVLVARQNYSLKDRSYLSALAVREAARRAGIAMDVFDLLSYGAHARRSRIVYQQAFGAQTEVGVIAAQPPELDQGPWWTSSAGSKSVVMESIAWAWTECCFWPDAPAEAEPSGRR